MIDQFLTTNDLLHLLYINRNLVPGLR